MDREKEIEKAAKEYEASPVDWNNEDIEIRDFFKRGAEWADEHPRKGLVDINNVCKFLDGYSFIPTYVVKELKNEFSKGE